jgi:hypothetical protein
MEYTTGKAIGGRWPMEEQPSQAIAAGDLEHVYTRLDSLIDAITNRQHRVENLCHRIYGTQLEMTQDQAMPSPSGPLPFEAIGGRIDECFRQLFRFDHQLTALERL